MRRILLIVALVLSGCLSPETKILSRKIANSTKSQETELAAKLRGDESAEATKLRERASKLSEATSGLADILGAPKEVK